MTKIRLDLFYVIIALVLLIFNVKYIIASNYNLKRLVLLEFTIKIKIFQVNYLQILLDSLLFLLLLLLLISKNHSFFQLYNLFIFCIF